MEISLEKIELVKDRTGASYKEAKDALEACEGSVVDAIILIEQRVDGDSKTAKAESVVNNLAEKLKELVRKGNVTKISVKRNGEVMVNIPVNAGIIGVALAPWTMLIACAATFGTNCKVEIVTDDGKTIDVSEKVQGGVDYAKEKGEQAWGYAKEKGPEVWNFAKEKGGQAWDYAKEKGGQAWDYAKEKAPEVWAEAKEGGEKAWDYAKEKGMDAWDFAKEKLEERKSGKESKLFEEIDFSELDAKIGKEDEK